MLTTIVLSLVMMAGLLLMLWGAVGFVQEERFFSSAPQEVLDVIQPKEERFRVELDRQLPKDESDAAASLGDAGRAICDESRPNSNHRQRGRSDG